MPEPRSLRPAPAGPVHPLPASVIGLAVVIFGIEVMFELAQRGLLGGGGGLGWRASAIRDWVTRVGKASFR